MTGDFIAVIPARGGSKRVPGKNIRTLAGRPLLAYAVDAAKAAGLGAVTTVSTEDRSIADVARALGARVIERPADLASDTASTESVLLHVLAEAAKHGWTPRWVVTLPPTSPFRRSSTIKACCEVAQREQVDCIFTVTETKADFWRVDERGDFTRLFPDAPRRQQDRAPLFEENSAVYVTSTEALRTSGSILGRSRRAVAIDPLEAFDINTELDFSVVEALMAHSANPTLAPRFL